jgi:hypothetical protein
MNFEKHLFVSYAHVDDLPTPGEEQGWVTRFHHYLEAYLSQSIGEEARIWRDERLHGNDLFASEIVNQLSKTAVLLSILSPRYMESDWCLKEVDEFCKTAEAHGGLTVEDKTRVFRIMLKRIPTERRERLPHVLKDALGYEFYEEAEGRRDLPLDPSFGSGETYRRQIYFLAQDIAELIARLKQKEAGPSSTEDVCQRSVYLAECSYDQREERDKIRCELRAHGYNVLPDQLAQLPELESEYVAEVGRLLERCQVSVHLIGKSRGKVPDGPSQKSAVQLQNEIAAEHGEKSGLHRLIWIPDGLRSEQAEQQAFIEALQKVPEMQRMADLIAADIETFKNALHSMLRKLEKSAQAATVAPVGAKLVYLICDQRDRPATIPLRKLLKAKGLEVAIPVFEGNASTLRQANEELLTRCDAAVIFYGVGDEAWRRTVESDIRKGMAYRETKGALASYLYLAPPDTDDKNELIELEESNLINALQGFSEADVTPLLQSLKP